MPIKFLKYVVLLNTTYLRHFDMAFIRVQKLVRDSNGNILSCSAAIKESQYIKDGSKFHSRQIVRERFGKVVWLASDGKSGIFLFFPPPRLSEKSSRD